MIDPILSVGTVILIFGSILANYLIAKFKSLEIVDHLPTASPKIYMNPRAIETALSTISPETPR